MKAPALSRHLRRSTRAFTLIEVIITLTIFIILTASVFGIMTAVFQNANSLQDNQNRRDQVSALRAFLQKDLVSLTARDQIVSYVRGDGDGLAVSGIILALHGTFQALDAQLQSNGLYVLRLGRPSDVDPNPSFESFTQEVTKNQSSLAWTPLIRDVRTMGWKFRAANSTDDWVTDWNSSQAPGLVECSIQLAGDDLATPMDFKISPMAPPPFITTVLITNAP